MKMSGVSSLLRTGVDAVEIGPSRILPYAAKKCRRAKLEPSSILLQGIGVYPVQARVGLGYCGVDADNLSVEILHRGRLETITAVPPRWMDRRLAIEPTIGHLQADHRIDRCRLHRATGDALHAVTCVAASTRCCCA